MSLENYGKYQLVKRLAMGGMAQIYLARRLGPEASDELVVVKRILPHLGENKEFVQMFLDEARIAARLAHPNIVTIHELGLQDDSIFIAMEYIHGEDVRRLGKRGDAMGRPLTVPLACRIVIDVCAGLDYAHKKTDVSGKPLNIVHRDISPQNILVTFKGVVKVVDFGIAKAADQATVTRSGVLKGKYSYMSPEQAAGKRVDCRSDVFALGVVLYELLTATRLFKRTTDMQTLSAVAECNVMPPSKVSPRVPADLDPIVMKALAKEPDARYSEALQLQVALEEWLSRQRDSATQGELAAFMSEVYAERLAREARSGSIVVEDDPPLTGQRTAVEGAGKRRSGASPSLSSKDVTRADRGDPNAAVAAAADDEPEPTDRSLRRPSRPHKTVDLRRAEPEPERPRPERRASNPRHVPEPAAKNTVEFRRTDYEPRGASVVEQEALSITGTTQPPSRKRGPGLWIAGLAVALAAVAVAIFVWPSQPPEPPEPPPATVRLETVPPGARVMFEGKPLPGATPLTLPPVAAGSYQVVISREGFQELRAAVAVPATGEVTLEALNLVPLPARKDPPPHVPPPVTPPPQPTITQVQLTLETEPAQATIFVDGQERGQAPQVVEARAEQELEVKASSPQHRPFSKRVKVGTGPSQVERLVLEPLPKPHPATPPPRVTRAPEQPRPSADGPKGLVRFAVTPWAEVTCNGRNLGTTPFPNVSLPVGTYQCKFRNPDYGTQSRSVEVRAETLNTVKVKF